MFINGCDTHAYVDSALADAAAAVNPDDPYGTKYLDVATNAMPAFFRSLPIYVRVGQEPDLRNYDCRPYRYGSNERCQVELPTAAPIHVMVHGYSNGLNNQGFCGLQKYATTAQTSISRLYKGLSRTIDLQVANLVLLQTPLIDPEPG